VRKGILGTKIGMLQIFDENGRVVPVTVIQAGPCVVTQKKTSEKDGYEAIQLGFVPAKDSQINKPLKGHFAKQGVNPMRYLKEIRVEDASAYEVGQEIKVDLFAAGDIVDVTGTTKGKGFQGHIKRLGFSRGPMAHGSKYHRRSGALNAKGPARVFRGRQGAGRMGGNQVTVQGLTVVKVDPEKNLLLVRGSVPGAKKSIITIRNSVKA